MQQKVFEKKHKNLPKQEKTSQPKRPSFLKKHGKKIMVFFMGMIGLIFVGMWYFWDEPLTSPLNNLSSFSFLSPQKNRSKKPIVYGFLPYWSVNNVTIQPELTHLAYFSLTIDEDGTIINLDKDGNTEPGFNKIDSDELETLVDNAQANNPDLRYDLVLTQFNNEDIQAFLSNPEAQQNLFTALDSIILAYPIQGINIDIEYSGEVSDELRANMVSFMQDLRSHLDKKYDHLQLSIDMYAGAATKYQIWDVENIEPEVDYIVVMAYDFHRTSSTQSGPVAPLFGGKQSWDNDINQLLKNFIAVVPEKKILLGVPFYGYEWRTTSTAPQATTYQGTGRTATYKRVQELLSQTDELYVEKHWDELALSPYLTYIEDDEIYTIYYEDPESLAYKLEYVDQLNLAGIAIWALGYEGGSRDMWDVIK